MASKIITELNNHIRTTGTHTENFTNLIKINSYQFFIFIFKDIRYELDHTGGSRSLVHYIDFRLILQLFLIFFDIQDAKILVKEVYKTFSFNETLLKENDHDDDDDDVEDDDYNYQNKDKFFSDLFDKTTNLYELISIEYKAIPSIYNIIKLNHKFKDFFSDTRYILLKLLNIFVSLYIQKSYILLKVVFSQIVVKF